MRIIPTEAETPSDGVFLATHSPIPVFIRNVVTNAGRGTRTTEDGLLQAVAEQPADQPILPILGGSGTGKSHLVRWLRTSLPPKETRRVIFVPKHHTSLRRILGLILDHATGERATELRKKVVAATEGFTDVDVAKLRLRSELALLIETQSSHSAVSSEDQDLRQYLASREGLPALLGDDIFRDALLNQNGPITRLVLEKLQGKGAEDKEEAFGFTADNLNLSVDDVSQAGTAAKSVAASLASDRMLRELAADMLNEQLGPAVSQVFGIGGDDLKDLLVEVRSEYKKQGLELLLLIEDFSIFQGVQGGLLDAITLVPTQGNDICPMRVVMAVTTGYFRKQMPDTVYTRVYKVFDLDDPEPQISFDTKAVAGRYLNAIRIGNRNLDLAYSAQGSIPNACEQCPVNDACHKAFGASDGYGLFPFNEHALDKAVRSKVVKDRLSVRDFLTRVLRPVMFNHHHDIDEGKFPSDNFNTDFRAGAMGTLDSVEDEHQLATPGDSEMSNRRVNLVRYFSPEGSGPQNLPKTIHAAFGVPQLETLQDPAASKDSAPPHSSSIPDPAPTHPPAAPQDKMPRQLPILVRAIDEWRGTSELSQGARKDLRNLIHANVIARLMLDDGLGGTAPWNKLVKPWDTAFDAHKSIAIGRETQATQTLITIDKNDIPTVRALRALAWVNAVGEWNAVENGEELQALVEEQISAWADAVSAAVLPDRDKRDDTELAITAHALLAMSKTLGVPEAFKHDALTRTHALFIPLSDDTNIARQKLRKWQERIGLNSQRLSREQLQQRVLRLASFTQGAGSSLALDVSRITRVMRGKDSGTALPPASGLLGETVRSIEAFHAALPDLCEEARAAIPDLRDLGGELQEVINQLQGLVMERAAVGQLPAAIDATTLSLASKAIKQGDQARAEGVHAKLDRWDDLSLDEQLRVITDDWDDPAARIKRWHTLASRAIQSLETRLGNSGGSAAQFEYERARLQLFSTLEALADQLTPTIATENVE